MVTIQLAPTRFACRNARPLPIRCVVQGGHFPGLRDQRSGRKRWLHGRRRPQSACLHCVAVRRHLWSAILRRSGLFLWNDRRRYRRNLLVLTVQTTAGRLLEVMTAHWVEQIANMRTPRPLPDADRHAVAPGCDEKMALSEVPSHHPPENTSVLPGGHPMEPCA